MICQSNTEIFNFYKEVLTIATKDMNIQLFTKVHYKCIHLRQKTNEKYYWETEGKHYRRKEKHIKNSVPHPSFCYIWDHKINDKKKSKINIHYSVIFFKDIILNYFSQLFSYDRNLRHKIQRKLSFHHLLQEQKNYCNICSSLASFIIVL